MSILLGFMIFALVLGAFWILFQQKLINDLKEELKELKNNGQGEQARSPQALKSTSNKRDGNPDVDKELKG